MFKPAAGLPSQTAGCLDRTGTDAEPARSHTVDPLRVPTEE